jgi:hypothetical protein
MLEILGSAFEGLIMELSEWDPISPLIETDIQQTLAKCLIFYLGIMLINAL